MSKKAFLCALLIALMVLGGLPLASAPVSAPAIEWQREYEEIGNNGVESVCNLIQTSDGGYAFLSRAWGYQFTFKPSTFFKVDSSGDMQWNKTIRFLSALTLIQTKDEGYEIAGQWSTYGTTYEHTPTLIKTDSQGNIQWVQNYSSVPDLGINATFIQTSDGGFAYLQFWDISIPWATGVPSGGIAKTDSNYNTQWVKNLTYTSYEGTFPLVLGSLIETSDGALAGVGVGRTTMDNVYSGHIYLIKTEPFLPLPQQTPLPTPVLTPITPPTPTLTPSPNVEAIAITSLFIGMVAGAGLTLLLKRRKH